MSSRVLHDDETDVEAITVCLDGIAVVVNNANGVEDLSLEQLAGIFSGEITNWSEVGGSDGEIVVIGREAGSGTRDGFEEIVGVKDNCKYAQELTATGAVTAAVAANENAIGYASLSAVNDSVKALTVEGVACTEETVKDGSYKVQRPFNFVVKKDAELSEAAQAFVEYVTPVMQTSGFWRQAAFPSFDERVSAEGLANRKDLPGPCVDEEGVEKK